MKDRSGKKINKFSKIIIWSALLGTPIMVISILFGYGSWIQYLSIPLNTWILWDYWEYVEYLYAKAVDQLNV